MVAARAGPFCGQELALEHAVRRCGEEKGVIKARPRQAGSCTAKGCLSAFAMRFGDDFTEDVEGALDPFGADVRVGDEADGVGCGVERPNTMWFERVADLDAV